MSNINRWLDEKEFPMYTNSERLISVIYSLGIVTKEQLRIITGWTEYQVNETIRAIRNKIPTPETLKVEKEKLKKLDDELKRQELQAKIKDRERKLNKQRDKWLTVYQASKKEIAYYTLGELGVKLACDMRQEPFKAWKVSPKVQAKHYVGIGDILCRIRKQGIIEDEWLNGKETERELYYFWNRYKNKGRKRKRGRNQDDSLPCRPDGLLDVNDQRFFIEFDTGTESKAKLRERFYNYLRLWNTVDESLPAEKVVWVVTSEKRKEHLREAAYQAQEHFVVDHNKSEIYVPESFVFVEGEETDFLLGKSDSVPFWGGE